MTEQIARSVRDFVLPLVPSGSLDGSLSLRLEEDAAAQGTRLHGRIQKRLARENPGLRCEQPVAWTFAREGFECLVRGRVDAIFPDPAVEEIKTTYRPQGLIRALAADPLHPFLQQVRMYAWILGRTEGAAPACRLRVVSLLDETEALLDVAFDMDAFSRWVEFQVEGLHAQVLQAAARSAERRRIGRQLAFPFATLRPGQERLRTVVEEALDSGAPLLLQAPTGLGKTAAILYPGLQKALADDLRLFYLTPRNSQQAVAEAFLRRLRDAGHPLRSVTLRAKERICPQDEVQCHPEVCPRASGYYDRLQASRVLETLAALGCADSEAICEQADAHCLCPFELSLDAARNADVIIGDYNYALSPSATLVRFFGAEAARNLLLLDEAHNLPGRAVAWFSPVLDLDQLKALKRPRRGDKKGLRAGFLRQLDRCVKLVGAQAGPHREIELDPDLFTVEEQRIRTLLGKAGTEGSELAPSHPLVQLHRQWSEFSGVLRERSDTQLLTWSPPGRLQITCVDASAHLKARFSAVAGTVLFSATLKPFEYYERLCGLAESRQEEIPSPFAKGNRCLLLVPQISTRFRRRSREAPRIAEFLSKVLPLRRGNYLVFFPSFDFLEQTQPLLDLLDFRVLAQPRRAGPGELDPILAALRHERGLVVLAVQGGSLAEGIDLPGDALIGCVVVGPPIPPFDLERRLTQAFFDRSCGEGEAYTTTYPAMAKSIQAAGRVIRGPDERGLLVFLDDRFLEPGFARCFPQDWFLESPREAVSGRILADVARFWEQP